MRTCRTNFMWALTRISCGRDLHSIYDASELEMISAEALQQVELKKTGEAARRDRSAPALSLAGSEPSSEEKEKDRQYFFSTGVDRWYASLSDVTFRTEFLALAPDEARAIVGCWEREFKNRTSSDPDPVPESIKVPSALRALEKRIDSVIATLGPRPGVGKGAFVKLSTRSPKDSPVAFAKARQAYGKAVSSLGASPALNDKLVCLAEEVILSLKVTSGEEAIRLLVSSDRVGEDLEYALEPGDEGLSSRVSLLVREWVDIPSWAEFRGFVWNGTLNAIGQYNHLVVFPELKSHTAAIRADLEAFYASIRDRIPLSNYIIDFAWTKDRVYLVEVNPFDGKHVFPASTGLWSWERDRQQMMNGPLELRTRETEESWPVLKNAIDPKWRAVVLS